MSPAISMTAVTKVFGERRALAGLDLRVEVGEVFGFLGPNGAGKTTTMRILVDLLRPTSGTVSVFGNDPQVNGEELRRRIGYLPGDLRIDGRVTAAALLKYLCELRASDFRSAVAIADRLELDLSPQIRRLSKGNRQKVGIVQAFMHRPELLILDEPTAGLDPVHQTRFWELVYETRDDGRTVFLSSHVLSELEKTTDRVAVIRNGRAIVTESVAGLLAQSTQRVEVTFNEPVDRALFDGVSGLREVNVVDAHLTAMLRGPADTFVKTLAKFQVASIRAEEPRLDERLAEFFEPEAR